MDKSISNGGREHPKMEIPSLDELRRRVELGLLEDEPAPLPRPADFDAQFSERWDHVDEYLADMLAGRDVTQNLIDYATALHEQYEPPMVGKMLHQFLKEADISDEERRENLNKLPWIVNQHTNPRIKALI